MQRNSTKKKKKKKYTYIWKESLDKKEKRKTKNEMYNERRELKKLYAFFDDVVC